MKLLVFGKTGQVAKELARRCPSDIETIFLGRDHANLLDPASCRLAITEAGPDAVINAAAWTAVDGAEEHEAQAMVVNAGAPAEMASACAELGVPFLQISTDYVFDGQGDKPFKPGDQPAPLGAYGRSKLAGEIAIRQCDGQHLILRTSWVVSAHGANFVKTMLRLGRERENLRVVADQMGGPTSAAAIADVLFTAARALREGRQGGVHHFAGAPDTSWADFARAIMSTAAIDCRIDDIPSAEYPTTAPRPLNSRLDCRSFEDGFGIIRPDWREGLTSILKDLGEIT